MAVTSQMRTKNGRIKPATKSIQAEPQYQSNELPRKSKQNPSKCTFRFFTRSPSFCHNQLIYKRNAHIYSYPILYISFFCPYIVSKSGLSRSALRSSVHRELPSEHISHRHRRRTGFGFGERTHNTFGCRYLLFDRHHITQSPTVLGGNLQTTEKFQSDT